MANKKDELKDDLDDLLNEEEIDDDGNLVRKTPESSATSKSSSSIIEEIKGLDLSKNPEAGVTYKEELVKLSVDEKGKDVMKKIDVAQGTSFQLYLGRRKALLEFMKTTKAKQFNFIPVIFDTGTINIALDTPNRIVGKLTKGGMVIMNSRFKQIAKQSADMQKWFFSVL